MIKINLIGVVHQDNLLFHLGLIGYGISVLLLVSGMYLFQNNISKQIEQKQETILKLKEQNTQLQKQLKEAHELEAKSTALKEKLEALNKLNKFKTAPIQAFDDFNNAIPDKVWIRSINEKNGEWQIKGRAIDTESLAQFLKNLDKSKYFYKTDIVKSDQVYYSKRTGQIQNVPDFKTLENNNRVTKSEASNTGNRWKVREKRNNSKHSDEFNIKIKEFIVKTKVNYLGKEKSEVKHE